MAPPTPRIGLAIETDGPGGAETVVLQLAEAFIRRGLEVIAIGPREGEGWLSARLHELGVSREPLELSGPLDLRSVRRLTEILSKSRIGVLHSHEFTMAAFGALATQWARVPHVITLHGGTYPFDRTRRRAAMDCAVRLSKATACVSIAAESSMRDHVSPAAMQRVEVVYNGVEHRPGSQAPIRKELGLSESDFLILAVGNLYPVKGHALLIQAVANLIRHVSASARKITVAIAGRGAERAQLERLASEAGIAEQVRLMGFRSDIPDLLAACDLFVMPSYSEGLPIALVEAMLAGRPVIASAVGGIPEVITSPSMGSLVRPGDVQGLLAAISEALEHPRETSLMAKAGQLRARAAFSSDQMTASYLRLYGLRSDQPQERRASVSLMANRSSDREGAETS